MGNKKNVKRYKLMLHDIAESVSMNEESADLYLKEEGVDLEKYVSDGMKQINALLEKKKALRNPRKKRSERSNLYFKRAVLAAKFASDLYEEPTFGHVKFQKLVYLGEQICQMKVDNKYSKQAAGPYDRMFMHSIDAVFKRQKWFEVNTQKSNNIIRYKYIPMDNMDNYQKYYHSYYTDFDEKIQWLIDTFRKHKTDKVELIATIFYCWKEINESNNLFSNELVIKKFYKWSSAKKRFSKNQILAGIEWMKKNELTPEI